MNNILEIKNVNMHYGKKRVLTNINLELEPGKIVGLCGPNGAGKTTLIKIIVGLLKDFKGEVKINDKKIGAETKAVVSYLPDVEYLDSNMTAQKISSLYKDMYADFDMALLEDLFIKMKLDGRMPVGQMSKGMREKFQLALCLSRKADVYVLDEPIAGVDPASRDSIIETIIETYTKDALLLISTHLIQDIEPVLEEVIFLKEGSVVLHQNCDDLREERGMSVDGVFREEFKW
ncbi:ABC transporter ATP-binding protein [Erysipelothrix urinaevulpis]|uniref:ABC transporter ATP-binding protein n=1 Tax=Erysipelothrix urinaevulpis TaxID=2683717 RepID=UPI00135B82FF|nr:ABC transporter ATP-binding protein [Erysipelothrix urinaevulpis]